MTLKERLMNDLKSAMKSGDQVQKDVIRILRGAIRNVELEQGHELTDDEALKVIMKQAKQRRDSIEQFQDAGRQDLVEVEQQELQILEKYLPTQLSNEEIQAKAEAAIAELGVTDMKGMGQIMGKLTKELSGVADGKRISAIVRQLLNQ